MQQDAETREVDPLSEQEHEVSASPPRTTMMDEIQVRGAREHNLKNINVAFPRNQLVVITGLSGSGKSSLAFDTIYAEGQRRYVESLSSYARQFLPQMNKPDVDWIGGLSPAISIEQKTTHRNPRSTVGTVTEIYDYLRLLFARIGDVFCFKCNEPIQGQTPQQMVDRILELPPKTRFSVLAPIVRGRKGEYRKELEQLRKDGYVRVRIDGETFDLSEQIEIDKNKKHDMDVYIDRLAIRDGVRTRLTDSVETALRLSDGILRIAIRDGDEWLMSEHHACIACGISYPEVEPRMFSFNAPQGACEECSGLGFESVVDPDLIVPDKELSLAEGAIAPWGKTKDSRMGEILTSLCDSFEESVDTSFAALSEELQMILLYGKQGPPKGNSSSYRTKKGKKTRKDRWRKKRRPSGFEGIVPMMQRLYRDTESEWRREEISNYMRQQACHICSGERLRKESRFIRIKEHNIADVCALPIGNALEFFQTLQLNARDAEIARRILKELRERLHFLVEVGLDYLSLDRTAGTLSGGEAQRIRLATQIGSSLMGVLYVLDEPSIGLHPRDNDRLLQTLFYLRDLGNTVVVVEHDEETMRSADHLIDMGPGAGVHGGEIVAEGPVEDVIAHPESLTGLYLSGKRSIPIPAVRRPGNGHSIHIFNAHHNNLKHIDVSFPLGQLVCVTGVSGSGKSSLVIDTLHRYLSLQLHGAKGRVGKVGRIEGLEHIDKVININQTPIGRTPRSNPATYVDLFTPIRQIFAQLPESRARGYKLGRFSFNVKGGRCDACEGAGILRIEMHFLPDVFVQCEECKGKRFNRETLEIQYKGASIADILDMSVEEALTFLEAFPKIKRRLQTLMDVGLSYVKLGQSATTLSGGEAQRVKLAKELSKRSTGRTFYILDEPTTGLHFEDIHRLLQVLHRLVDEGNTVTVIEHQLDVIKTADWLIDLGPEGGLNGGTILTEGSPEEVAQHPASYTGSFLKDILKTSKRTAQMGLKSPKGTKKKAASTKSTEKGSKKTPSSKNAELSKSSSSSTKKTKTTTTKKKTVTQKAATKTKKATTKKTETSKKTTVKKAASKKVTAKKSTAKKSATKKASVSKKADTAKKAVPKKTTAKPKKKSTARKTSTSKTVSRSKKAS